MLALKANDNMNIRCITSWQECNTRIFQRIVKDWEPKKPIEERNQVLLFSILTETPFKDVLESRDPELEAIIYQCTAFVYEQAMYFKSDQVEVIKLRGQLISVPKKLEALTVEQNMHIRRAMKTAENLEELISLACSVYLQPLVDGGPYNHDKAMTLEKEILELPIWQTFAVGFFYLSKLHNSGRYGLLSWNQWIQNLSANVRSLQRPLNPINWNHYMSFPSLTFMPRHTESYPE